MSISAPPRRKLTTLDKLKVVVDQARCPLCDQKLGELAGLQFDHTTPLALGGDDDIANLRAVHVECHAIKTTGRRGESDLSLRDGDQAKIAKTRRLEKKRDAFKRTLLARDAGEEPPPPEKRKRPIPAAKKPDRPAQRRASTPCPKLDIAYRRPQP